MNKHRPIYQHTHHTTPHHINILTYLFIISIGLSTTLYNVYLGKPVYHLFMVISWLQFIRYMLCYLFVVLCVLRQLNLQLQMTAKDLSPQILQILSLVRLKADCKITPTRVDFTPLNTPNATPISILPSFNQDKAFFTPSFILESEKKYFKDNSTFEKHQFEEKIQRSVQVISTLIPSQAAQNLLLPSPNTNYCQICRENFDNYFTHISLKLHRLRCTNTEMTPIINELCQDFAQRQARTNTKEKTKLIQKGRKQEWHLIQKAEKKQAKYLKVGKGPSVKGLTEGSSTKQSATSQSNK